MGKGEVRLHSGILSDPEEADGHLPFATIHIDFRQTNSVVIPIYLVLRGSITSTLRPTACCIAVLRLKLEVALFPPRTHSPVVGQPSGTGVSPAGLRDIAWPHLFLRNMLPHACATLHALQTHKNPAHVSPFLGGSNPQAGIASAYRMSQRNVRSSSARHTASMASVTYSGRRAPWGVLSRNQPRKLPKPKRW